MARRSNLLACVALLLQPGGAFHVVAPSCASLMRPITHHPLPAAAAATAAAAVAAPRSRRSTTIVAAEYSTKVKIMAETRAPLRQARIFFFYPTTIAGASIASYVSLLRVIGGKDALSDGGNLVVNALIVAGAAFLLKKDLDGRAEALEEIAVELGESSAPKQQEEQSVDQ